MGIFKKLFSKEDEGVHKLNNLLTNLIELDNCSGVNDVLLFLKNHSSTDIEDVINAYPSNIEVGVTYFL